MAEPESDDLQDFVPWPERFARRHPGLVAAGEVVFAAEFVFCVVTAILGLFGIFSVT